MTRLTPLLLLASLPAQANPGATVTACASGCDYPSIQEAVDSGALVVRLTDPSYSESVVVDDTAVRLMGASPAGRTDLHCSGVGNVVEVTNDAEVEMSDIAIHVCAGARGLVIDAAYRFRAENLAFMDAGFAVVDGNYLHVKDSDDVTLISSAFFATQGTAGNGGHAYIKNSNVDFWRPYMEYGRAILGGSIYASGSTVRVFGGSFVSNAATGSGGAIYSGLGSLVVMPETGTANPRTRFLDNTATENGGAVSASDAWIDGADFCRNTAQHGGAYQAYGNSSDNETSIYRSVFLQNDATGFAGGGAIYLGGVQNVAIDHGTFLANDAGNGSAIHANASYEVAVRDSLFVAQTGASDIRATTNEPTLSNLWFHDGELAPLAGFAGYTAADFDSGAPGLLNTNWDDRTILCAGGLFAPTDTSPIGNASSTGSWIGAIPPYGVDGDGDGFGNDVDCDDSNQAVNPDAEEVCDGLDNDCDGKRDRDATDGTAWYRDRDGDLLGDATTELVTCSRPALGWVPNALDCNDADGTANIEICDGLDNDCDGAIDDAGDADGDGVGACNDCDDNDVSVSSPSDWWPDADDDGFGDGDATNSCGTPPLDIIWAQEKGDCDDNDASINPTATEVCDGVDNNCTGAIDDIPDMDGDGAVYCDDCDDDDPTTYPGANERCDGVDNNCNGVIDDSTSGSWFEDADGDGFGNDVDGPASNACDPASDVSWVDTGGDCNDASPNVNPDAIEVCNGIDDDCDNELDEGTAAPGEHWWDGDGDGYGNADTPVDSCADVEGAVNNASDCNDTDPTIYPGADEPRGSVIDVDCDGSVNVYIVGGGGSCSTAGNSGGPWALGLALIALAGRRRQRR